MLFRVPETLLQMPEEFFGTTTDELMMAIPEYELKKIGNERTKWKLGEGAHGTGRFAVAVLRFDKSTQETLVLGAIERDAAPEHEHTGGETILTLAGVGTDVTDTDERVEMRRGLIIVHGAKTIHAPGSRAFWVFIYYQPTGMRLTAPVS